MLTGTFEIFSCMFALCTKKPFIKNKFTKRNTGLLILYQKYTLFLINSLPNTSFSQHDTTFSQGERRQGGAYTRFRPGCSPPPK